MSRSHYLLKEKFSMKIENKKYQELIDKDILICALGYESRSWYIIEQNIANRNSDNTMVFMVEKNTQNKGIANIIEAKDISIVKSDYNDSDHAKMQLVTFIQRFSSHDRLRIHIDYSSMPRSWYCSFVSLADELVGTKKELLFWYVSGNYPDTYKNYPSAGIDSISVFAGLALPAVDRRRIHIIGLGYDYIRTETVISIIEPESLIACYAYNPQNSGTIENAYNANKKVIDRALLSVALPIDDFSSTVDRLCELVYNSTLDGGQVVLVPDGPKPLIMAMSLVPSIIKKAGITCLHISRNSIHYSKSDVKPRQGEVYGFIIQS